jgi:SAM-dependent methyltransferase
MSGREIGRALKEHAARGTMFGLLGTLKRAILHRSAIWVRVHLGAGVPFRPVNYIRRDPAELQSDVAFSIQSAHLIAGMMREAGLKLEGAHFLEIGPGTHFGAQLILASMGARVTLADRFLARWQKKYHPMLYRELHKAWDGPNGALEAVIDANGYPPDVITLLEEPAEALVSVPSETVDFTYSNAVLEHVTDMDRVAAEMFRVMKPGASGAHQVDMRYHPSFDRPLEHVVMSDEDYAAEVAVHGYESGNRLRPSEFIAYFERHGLQVTQFSANSSAEPEYFEEALRRLRNARSSYRNWPEDDLRSTGGRFFIRRLAGTDADRLRRSAEERLERFAALKRLA